MLQYSEDNLHEKVESLADIITAQEVRDGHVGKDYGTIWIDNEQTDCSSILAADINVEMSKLSDVAARSRFVRYRPHVGFVNFCMEKYPAGPLYKKRIQTLLTTH